jgi:hypothetical protein
MATTQTTTTTTHVERKHVSSSSARDLLTARPVELIDAMIAFLPVHDVLRLREVCSARNKLFTVCSGLDDSGRCAYWWRALGMRAAVKRRNPLRLYLTCWRLARVGSARVHIYDEDDAHSIVRGAAMPQRVLPSNERFYTLLQHMPDRALCGIGQQRQRGGSSGGGVAFILSKRARAAMQADLPRFVLNLGRDDWAYAPWRHASLVRDGKHVLGYALTPELKLGVLLAVSVLLVLAAGIWLA